jgi:hypothetical protein
MALPSPGPRLGWRPRAIAAAPEEKGMGPLPVVSADDWADTEAMLAALYRRVEQQALDTIDGQRRRGHDLRSLSRLTQALAVLFAGVGVLLPVIAAARHDIAGAAWCSVFFATALALLAVEQLCGLAAAGARRRAGALRAHQALELFQDDWAAACVPGAQGGGVADRLALLRTFTADLRALAGRGAATPDTAPSPAGSV